MLLYHVMTFSLHPTMFRAEEFECVSLKVCALQTVCDSILLVSRARSRSVSDCGYRMQERKAAVIRAEGESESARLISEATKVAGPGLIELRRIEAAKDIASSLSKSGNVMYLPGTGSNMLLGINPGK